MERMWITTEHPAIVFEDTEVGRLKKEIWDASEEEIDRILAEYGIPSPPELGKPGTYIQTTPRAKVVENRKKNDIVIIPVASTERHGEHSCSGHDIFQVTQLIEGLRRYTEKQGRPVNLVFPPIIYGAHPYHHIGMPGTIIMPEEVVRETLIHVMLGLWNDGFRKQLIINNHGQLWVLESALHEFMYRYQLPGIYQIFDWHRCVREFFTPCEKTGWETDFVHSAEHETSLGLLLFPEGMIDMSKAIDEEGRSYLPGGHFDTSVDPYRRPHRWSEGEGHSAIELAATPHGSVGKPTLAKAEKAKRPVAAILRYLTLVIDQILEAFPPGVLPPVEEVTLRTAEEMAPYLKWPEEPGWRPVYALPRRGFSRYA
ncbi:creatininase family protein [Candidatus Bipolaricaulota bacterium]|nr:creatininase family protein [Candidatus Bipolaricaulota bacterium]